MSVAESPHVAGNDVQQVEGRGIAGYVEGEEVDGCDSRDHALVRTHTNSRVIRLLVGVPQGSVKGLECHLDHVVWIGRGRVGLERDDLAVCICTINTILAGDVGEGIGEGIRLIGP